MSRACRSRYLPSETNPRNAQPGPQAKTRRCLKCRCDFLSAHWGNRICDDCRNGNARIAPGADAVASCGHRVTRGRSD